MVDRNPLEGLIDWEKSKAVPGSQSLIYINGNAFNSKGEVEAFRDRLVEEIREIRNPINGDCLAKRVYTENELYSGEYLDRAPDIIILPNEAFEIACKLGTSASLKRNIKVSVIIPTLNDQETMGTCIRNMKQMVEKYGISEEDFISADLEIVPAIKPREAGFDRSMIAAYGQDDRICAYTTLRAILDVTKPKETCIAVFVDREEIGSDGNAGAKSRFLEVFIGDLIEKFNGSATERDVLKAFINSRAISADVDAAVNPIYKDVHDTQNAGYLGKGVIVTKYTGAGGKYGASEAHAEFMAWIRRIFDKRAVPWQPGLLGKVDEGGGGTIAKYFAERGIDVVDIGPGLIGMHSPYEISSKADLYSAYLAYKTFFEEE